MSKVRTHLVNQNEKYKIIGEFFDIVANLKTKRDIIDFFISLLTPSEILMVARRIQIAEMLLEEKSYEDIRKELKVSYQTIARVYYWLHEGNVGFNVQIAQQIKRKRLSRSKDRGYKSGSLLNKYVGYRILADLLK